MNRASCLNLICPYDKIPTAKASGASFPVQRKEGGRKLPINLLALHGALKKCLPDGSGSESVERV